MKRNKFIKVTWIPRSEIYSGSAFILKWTIAGTIAFLALTLIIGRGSEAEPTFKTIEDFEGDTMVCPDPHNGFTCYPAKGV